MATEGTIYPERTVTDSETVINNPESTSQPKPKEADIPAATLQRWYYPREKSWVKNDLTNTDSQEATEKSYVKNDVTDDGIYLCVTHRIAAAGNNSKSSNGTNKPHSQRQRISFICTKRADNPPTINHQIYLRSQCR